MSLHTGPEAHAWVPAWQGLAGVHGAPTVQEAQAPALHTWFVPQLVPSARNVRSVQTGAPELHSMVAVASHGFVEVQVAPWVQLLQTPAGEQTWFVPQLVPAAKKVRSVHTGAPELHSRVAVAAQGFVEVQAVPWAQEVQAPADEQTWFVPQLVPAAR